jgi:hypothetical protein
MMTVGYPAPAGPDRLWTDDEATFVDGSLDDKPRGRPILTIVTTPPGGTPNQDVKPGRQTRTSNQDVKEKDDGARVLAGETRAARCLNC